jgi:hypothetical protein
MIVTFFLIKNLMRRRCKQLVRKKIFFSICYFKIITVRHFRIIYFQYNLKTIVPPAKKLNLFLRNVVKH